MAVVQIVITMSLSFSVSPKKILHFLLIVVWSLSAISLTTKILLINKFWKNVSLIHALSKLFDVDKEGNIPAFYSSFSLISCSLLLFFIAGIRKFQKGRYIIQWFILGLIFMFLSWDEAVQIHEKLIGNPLFDTILNSFGIQETGIFKLSWVVAAIPCIGVLLVTYFRFYLSLHEPIKKMFLLSVVLFISGAVGMEMVGGLITDNLGQKNLLYALETNIEELLEMLGIAFFIYSLLMQIHLFSQEINIVFLNDNKGNKYNQYKGNKYNQYS